MESAALSERGFINESENVLSGPCPLHDGCTLSVLIRGGKVRSFSCPGAASKEEYERALSRLSPDKPDNSTAGGHGAVGEPRTGDIPAERNTLPAVPQQQRRTSRREPEPQQQPDYLRRLPPQNLEAEQSVLGAIFIENEALALAATILKEESFYRESHRLIWRGMNELRRRGEPIDAITLGGLLTEKGVFEQVGGGAYVAELAATVPTAMNVAHYAKLVRDAAFKREIATRATDLAGMAYNGVSAEGLLSEVARLLSRTEISPAQTQTAAVVAWEGMDAAIAANEAYLARTAVIDRLCYSHAVSMITGGKHAGKSTLARWLAICVAKGYPFLGREVRQGPVFYIASEDETMAARSELIRLGWAAADPLQFLSAQNISSERPEEFLEQLTGEIQRRRAGRPARPRQRPDRPADSSPRHCVRRAGSGNTWVTPSAWRPAAARQHRTSPRRTPARSTAAARSPRPARTRRSWPRTGPWRAGGRPCRSHRPSAGDTACRPP